MITSLIAKSFLIGAIAACAIGPVFILVVLRSSTQGFFSGFSTAIGLAAADATLFTVGMIGGGSLAQENLTWMIKIIEKAGSFFLIFMGIYTLMKKTIFIQRSTENSTWKIGIKSYFWFLFSSMFLTLSNPVTWIFFTSISIKLFPSIALLSKKLIFAASTSLFLGSLTTFSIISFLASKFGCLLSEKLFLAMKIISGSGFIAIGSYLLLEIKIFS